MHIIISYSYVDNECIVIRVVETSSIFFREPNDRAVHPCHPWYGIRQLDVLNHPEVNLPSLLGRPSRHCAPYDHYNVA